MILDKRISLLKINSKLVFFMCYKNFNWYSALKVLHLVLEVGRVPMEDEDLERIRIRKLREMIGKSREKKDGDEAKTGESPITRPVEVCDATLGEVIQSHPIVVIDCWAPWCPPCRILSPIIEELAREYAGKILFGKLNVDENQGTALQYSIMSIPTLLIFKNEKLVDRIVGAMPRNMLEQRITRYL